MGRWDCLLMALGHIFPEELKDSQSRQNKRMKNRKCIRRKGKNIKVSKSGTPFIELCKTSQSSSCN